MRKIDVFLKKDIVAKETMAILRTKFLEKQSTRDNI